MDDENESEPKSEEERQAEEQFGLQQGNALPQNETRTDNIPQLTEIDDFIGRWNQGKLSQQEKQRVGNGSISGEITTATEEWKELSAQHGEISSKISQENRQATEGEQTQLESLQKRITSKQAEAISSYSKITEGRLIPKETGSDQYTSAQAERSRQDVDSAMNKVRAAEANGDSDDIAEARANHKRLSEEHDRRSREVKEDETDFSEQMSGR